jgi:hypothetical protein
MFYSAMFCILDCYNDFDGRGLYFLLITNDVKLNFKRHILEYGPQFPPGLRYMHNNSRMFHYRDKYPRPISVCQ